MKISRLALVPACLALASCSVMDIAGPRPNSEVLALARQAEADSLSLHDAPAAELRSRQAAQLYDEITRLCGTDAAGAPPATCEVERGPGEAAGAPDVGALTGSAAEGAARALSSLPDESVDLVVAQAVDATALQPVNLPPVTVADTADLEAAREMLRREFAVEYALGLASSYADADLSARIDALGEAAEQRRDYLTGLLAASGEIPVPAPGYEFSGRPEPADSEQAAALVDEMEECLVAEWRATAAGASTAPWMTAAIALAAQAQRGSI
ncbi:DUF4439 domain-containing protein [uncultured Corynebacterium sp.]|uniref:DUF4439 domain-containing protein n=1 Tax=uncultured Corynebacterium sp. TaxID=159447 RepID=UPI0025970800|nr:DUF4439 domain-containing protein [uncultured Corynebacterium sp.]